MAQLSTYTLRTLAKLAGVDSGGNVGLNDRLAIDETTGSTTLTSPAGNAANINLSGPSGYGGQLNFIDNGVSTAQFYGNSGSIGFGSITSAPIAFFTNSITRFNIQSAAGLDLRALDPSPGTTCGGIFLNSGGGGIYTLGTLSFTISTNNTTRVTFDGTTGIATFTAAVSVGGYAVATLPAAGTVGRKAYVTDGAGALAWGATVTGGGTTKYLVWDNGINWTVVGK